MSEEWFSPSAIKFTKVHTLWLLHNLQELHLAWPVDSSSYIDQPGKLAPSSKAPFATPIEYAAEIEQRLEKCGIDGLILESVEVWGKSVQVMCRYLGMTPSTIDRKMNTALRYVASGPSRRWHNSRKRKAESYKEFKDRIRGKR